MIGIAKAIGIVNPLLIAGGAAMIRVATLENVWLMAENSHPGADKRPNQGDAESTLHLLERVRAGDRVALDRLCARYLPRLRRWATGRLPRGARDLIDTDDLVQDTLVRTIHNIDEFEHRREGAFQAYVRQALLNRIRDEARRAQRRPQQAEPANDPAYPGPSPLEEMIGVEAVERYEAALKRLRDQEREAIVARIEMGLSYDEVAAALKRPSADAARMLVGRALLRLAKEMRRES